MERRDFIRSGAATLALALMPQRLAAVAPAAAGTADARLLALLEATFRDLIRSNPELATSLGLDTGADAALKRRLNDRSFAAVRADQTALRGRRAELARFDHALLSEGGRLNHAVADYLLTSETVSGDRFDYVTPEQPYQISQLTGSYQSIPDFLDSQHVVADADGAESYLARLAGFATALGQDDAEQRRLADKRIVAPGFALDLALGQMAALRGKPAAETVLVESIVRRTKEKGIAGDWGARAEKIVATAVFPALDRQIALVQAQRAAANDDAGIWRLPEGEAMYAAALRSYTTTGMSPTEVHALGLAQVAEIGARIDAILKAQGLTQGAVGARLTALGKDPKQLFANDAAGRAKLLAYLNDRVADMSARLPRAFATLPKARLAIRAVPTFIQDGAPLGYYSSATLDGSRPAIYYINLKDTAEWPRYGLPTLTYHEGTPGHHLQISIAQEAPGLPMLRKLSPFGAYVEGWALYAEQLAGELGAYESDPLGEVGFLQSFLFRAVRLVVDTGMHHERWSRARATDYMVAQTGFAPARAQREIDRYCVWPGQACSYKVGHMAWVAARERAQKALGARFDLRRFHEVLLDSAVPLTLLDGLVDRRLGIA